MKTSHRVVVLSLLLAPLVWLIDTLVDYTFFRAGAFWGVLWADLPAHELYARGTPCAIILLFGLLLAFVLRRLERTKGELQSTVEKYRGFFRTSADPVFITTRDGRWVDMNEAAIEMFGYDSREELEQVPIPDLYADPVEREEHLQRIIEKGFTRQYPIRLRRKDGTGIDTLITSSVRANSEGEVLGFQGTIRDVTDRKKAEREREQLVQDLGERVKELKCLYDVSSLAANSQVPVAELLGQVVQHIPPGWRYEDIACARIKLEDREFTSPGFEETEWRQATEILVSGQRVGSIEVFYTEEKPPADEGPFLQEERNLLNTVADLVGRMIQRRRTEAALRSSRERMRRTIAAAPFPIMVHAEDGEVVTINEVWTDITGYAQDEIPTIEDWTGRAYGERGEEVESDIDALYDMDGRVDLGEYELTCKDGSKRVWAFSSAPLGRAPDGRRLVVSMAMDVTERKEAEQRARGLNSLLRAIRKVNQLLVQEDNPKALLQRSCETLLETRQYKHVWAVTFDRAGDLRHTGQAEGGAPVDALFDRMQIGWRPPCVQHALVEPGRPICLDPTEECEDCPLAEVYGGSVAIKCAFESTAGAYGVISIRLAEGHERSAQEDALIAEAAGDIGHGLQRLETEQHLRLRDRALENATNGIALTDLDGAVVSANRAVLRMWRFEEESEILGRGASEFWKSPEAAREAFQQVKDQGVWEGEMTALRRDGSEFTAQAYLSVVTDQEGNPTHVLGVFDDITQRKQAEEELRAAYENLRETERQLVDQERQRALTTMASGIAHDFNNALSTIQGFTDLLLQNPEDLEDKETAREYLGRIAKAASNAAETVRRMRKFYRPAEELEFRLLDLNSILHEAVSMTEPRWRQEAQAEGKHIHVETELGDIPAVRGKEGELHEMVTNLIFNAVDAIEEQGRIALTTRAADGNVVLEVRDTGRGMDEDTRQRCLDPFFTTKGGTGTGLGLSVTDGIVRGHDGRIEIASEPGEGTTFRITLPAGTTETAGQTEPSAGIGEIESLRVLVVEDDGTERMMLVKMMEVLGHTAAAAADGAEALEELEHGYYHLIITDCAMPEMDGHELARRIKQRSPEQPIIMLTGFGDMMDAAGERPECVDLVLSKPATLDELRKAMAQVMGHTPED